MEDRQMFPHGTGESPERLADDLLEGVDAIAEFLYGSPEKRRKVYHLIQTARLPLFKLGGVWCARKSRLKAYVTEQEDRNSASPGPRRSV